MATTSFSSPNVQSNLERFLQCVTPTVPSRTLPQSCLHDLNSEWQPPDKDIVEYFSLGDLCDCYEEWSAYGVGTPIQLRNHDTVMQYYVPYLSAIQIYTSKSIATSRERREDNDVAEFESDSWSDDSCSDNLSRCLSNNSSRTWDAVSEDSSFEQEGSWPTRSKLGYLFLQYVEMTSPYWRVPFTDKITELARNHPALMSLKSVDLSPASWMAISWYPIYHIPSQQNEKDLSTCFLTYHTLSSSFQDTAMDCEDSNEETDLNFAKAVVNNDNKKNKKNGNVTLPAFGLVSYRMQGDIWLKTDTSDHERMYLLYSAADSWLKQLGFYHHDFNFFTFHSTL